MPKVSKTGKSYHITVKKEITVSYFMWRLSDLFLLVKMIKFERFFQFMPEPLVQTSALAEDSPYPRKWKELSY